MIQNVGLFPHLTVTENIALVPRLLGWAEARIRSRTGELLELVGIDAGEFSRRYPKHLSDGQWQRVGVARALAADPPILLMDEPFGAIDPIARHRLQNELKLILKKVRKTVVIVTHDIDEALKLGSNVAVMRDGKISQKDSPNTILQNPANKFVADFIGDVRALRRLELFTVEDVMVASQGLLTSREIPINESLHHALSRLISLQADMLTVTKCGVPVGIVHRDAILKF